MSKSNRKAGITVEMTGVVRDYKGAKGVSVPEKAMLIIMLNKVGDEFRADLHAPSEVNGLADLRIHHIGLHAVEVIAACLEELQAKAADGDAIALRFA